MNFLGDFSAGQTVRVKWNTSDPTGAPITASSVTIKIYKAGSSTTEVTTGVTHTEDFDGLTGLHDVAVDLSSDGAFYAAGADFFIVATAVTVNGVSLAGLVLGQFSVANRAVAPQTGDAYARLGAPAGASHAADVAAVKVDTAAVKTQTDKLAFTVTNQVDANVLDWKSATAPAMTGDAFARLGAPAGASVSADVAALPTATQNADALLKRDWTSVTGEAARSVLNALRMLRNKVTITSTTLTVTKEDDTTSAWTGAVTVDAGALPVTSVDPT